MLEYRPIPIVEWIFICFSDMQIDKET